MDFFLCVKWCQTTVHTLVDKFWCDVVEWPALIFFLCSVCFGLHTLVMERVVRQLTMFSKILKKKTHLLIT